MCKFCKEIADKQTTLSIKPFKQKKDMVLRICFINNKFYLNTITTNGNYISYEIKHCFRCGKKLSELLEEK